MKTMLKSVLKNSLESYVSLSYKFRHVTKWKRLNGVDLSVDNKLISKKIFGTIVRGGYEVDENLILRQTFTKEDKLLELGTGIGFNAIYCAQINDNKVLSFEGNPEMIPLIKKNMQRNKVSFALENEIVISKNFQVTSMSFNVVDEFWSSSSKTVPGNILRTVSVPTRDINTVVKEFAPTYLVVDIEGGEEDLFDDCYWIENSSIKKIMIELHADVIGEEKCFLIVKNLANIGFTMKFDDAPKHIIFFSKQAT